MQDDRYLPAGPRPSICLLMDVANIPEDSILPLVQELRRRGDLGAMFAFGDWHRRDMHLRHRLLDALGFLCIHGGSWENGSGGLKSMVDSIMKRTIKWVPQWFPDCNTYVLATGDRDFSHDASDLRWRGYRVWIAAGEASINNELRLGADEFISLDRLPTRVPPSVALGVPANYYETAYGNRGRFARSMPPAAAEAPAAPPPGRGGPPESRTAPGGRPSAPTPPPTAPPLSVTAMTPPPAVVASGEDRALLDQLREMSGGRGYVALREALRGLAPTDDAGGRARSRLSNQIRDLVERGLLVRTHATIGGNVTQVLALPGVTIAPPPAPTAEAIVVESPASTGDRRGRGRLPRRPRPEVEPEPEAEQEMVAAIADIGAIMPPAEGEADEPAPLVGPEVEAPAEAQPEPSAPVAAERPAMSIRPTAPAVPARPAEAPAAAVPLRRFERPSSRAPEPSSPPSAAAPSRSSWRDAVAAALAQARGEAGLRLNPAPSAPPGSAPPVPTASEAADEASPPASTTPDPELALPESAVPLPLEPAIGNGELVAESGADTPQEAALSAAEDGPAEPPSTGGRRRRRRPGSTTVAATEPGDGEIAPPITLDEVEPSASGQAAEGPARPTRPRRGRRRSVSGGESPVADDESAPAVTGAVPTP